MEVKAGELVVMESPLRVLNKRINNWYDGEAVGHVEKGQYRASKNIETRHKYTGYIETEVARTYSFITKLSSSTF